MNITKEVLSNDKIHTLKGVVYLPDQVPKGIFHLVHGMAEHIGRYDSFMSEIASNGYIVCGFDNLGHGKTASKDELGFISEKDGYKYLVDDVITFAREIKKDYPSLPYYLMGHSMGSFIVRLTAEKYGAEIDKLIVCGTGGPNPLAGAGIALCNILGLIKGARGYSKLINYMAFGSYNKRFPNGGKYAWLTKDEKIKKTFDTDPLCSYPFTISALKDLVKLNSLCNKKDWFKNMRKDLPIFLIAGTDDPVGEYGNGVTAVYTFLKQNGCDAKLKLYENCRHEIHNDTCRNEMLTDIMEFLG